VDVRDTNFPIDFRLHIGIRECLGSPTQTTIANRSVSFSGYRFRGSQVRSGGILAGQGQGEPLNEIRDVIEEEWIRISLRNSHLLPGY
jgi:hypothetical protein